MSPLEETINIELEFDNNLLMKIITIYMENSKNGESPNNNVGQEEEEDLYVTKNG